MLQDILRVIQRDGIILRPKIARELNLSEDLVDDGIRELIRMGFIVQEETGSDCAVACAKCPMAQTCLKEVVKTYQISEKGKHYLA